MKKHTMFRIIYMPMVFFLLSWLPSFTISAEEDETSKLQEKILMLEGKIKYLETLLEKCGSLTEEGSSETGWQNKKNWRRLETGMNMEKVQSILGKPAKTIQGVRILWYYPSIFCGYVSFDIDGNLIGWNEP